MTDVKNQGAPLPSKVNSDITDKNGKLLGSGAYAQTGEEFSSWVANCGAGDVPLRNVLDELENLAPINCEASMLQLDLSKGSLLSFIALDTSGAPIATQAAAHCFPHSGFQLS